jgi:hypothetical protein
MLAKRLNQGCNLLQGVAINFVKSDDIRILRDIEQFYSTQVCPFGAGLCTLVVPLSVSSGTRNLCHALRLLLGTRRLMRCRSTWQT